MKIDTEVAGLKTMLESHKLDTIKYLAGRTWQSCIVVMNDFLMSVVRSLYCRGEETVFKCELFLSGTKTKAKNATRLPLLTC